MSYVQDDFYKTRMTTFGISLKYPSKEEKQECWNFEAEYYLKTPEEMTTLFPEQRELILNINKITEACNFQIQRIPKDKRYELLPDINIPKEYSNESEYLTSLITLGLKMKYSVVTEEIENRVQLELNAVFSLNMQKLFLFVREGRIYQNRFIVRVAPIIIM